MKKNQLELILTHSPKKTYLFKNSPSQVQLFSVFYFKSVRNDTIHRDLKIDPIGTSMTKISTNFFENLCTIFNEDFVKKSPTMRCTAFVGGLALRYFFLMLLDFNLPAPSCLYTLFNVAKPSRSICCRGNGSFFLCCFLYPFFLAVITVLCLSCVT